MIRDMRPPPDPDDEREPGERSTAAMELIYAELRANQQMERLLARTDIMEFDRRLRRIVVGEVAAAMTTEGSDFLPLSSASDSLPASVAGFVGLLAELLRRPFPLGEDILLAALDLLAQDDKLLADKRVVTLVHQLRTPIVKKEPASEAVQNVEAGAAARHPPSAGRGREPRQGPKRSGSTKRKMRVDKPEAGTKAAEATKSASAAGSQEDEDRASDAAHKNSLRHDGDRDFARSMAELNAYATGDSFPELKMTDSQKFHVQASWLLFCQKKGGVEQAEQAICRHLRKTEPGFAQLLYGAENNSRVGKIDPRTGLRKETRRRAQSAEGSSSQARAVNDDRFRADIELINRSLNGLSAGAPVGLGGSDSALGGGGMSGLLTAVGSNGMAQALEQAPATASAKTKAKAKTKATV
eukprot:gnl/TRDRNA2_/TRDRNA2_80167_c0_seq1.p1 gnl/TRDRNA2_/TRDRNA2_80167_c0~~gnl/TRDRNA2_/TRDRNA2_80167_c0_seq1.p1  ORF type:complete len:412 (-),score=76.48 gnl/TRDRNA2_/TRDRNA2_80167_c0_seq1:67-1302(-)